MCFSDCKPQFQKLDIVMTVPLMVVSLYELAVLEKLPASFMAKHSILYILCSIVLFIGILRKDSCYRSDSLFIVAAVVMIFLVGSDSIRINLLLFLVNTLCVFRAFSIIGKRPERRTSS